MNTHIYCTSIKGSLSLIFGRLAIGESGARHEGMHVHVDTGKWLAQYSLLGTAMIAPVHLHVHVCTHDYYQ